ncbi:MAG: D-alanyl-D-alanine carboxypeptidase, partial [Hyphomicrobiales bacterium]
MTRVRTFALLAALLGAVVLSSCDTGGPPSYLSPPDARPPASPAADVPDPQVPPGNAATPVVAEPVHTDARPALQPAAWGHVPAALRMPAPALSASAAVVIDEASGQVLYDIDAHRQLPPASLTKIATAMVVLESGIDLNSQYTTDVDSELMYNSSVMGLKPGDRFTIRDLLYGMLLPSGNDAALALGRAVAGSDTAFVA